MSARLQFTITLGSGGQVVKRARPISDTSHSDDDIPSLGGKLSERERLASNMANSNSYGRQYENKRQRTGDHDSKFNDKNLRDKQIKSNQVGRDDLRWKLINKSLSQKRHFVSEGQYDVDLREKLYRNIHASCRSDAQQHATEARTSDLVRRIHSTRSADDLLKLDLHRKYNSSWTTDQQKHSSQNRLISVPNQKSLSRRYKQLQHASAIRSANASRTSFLTRSEIGAAARSLTSTSKSTTSVDAAHVVRAPVRGAIGQRSILVPEEPLTVAVLLDSLGLGKYVILFQVEEVDMTALRQMGDNDLKELGIPMGPRKKILRAVLSRTRQQQRLSR